MLTAASLAKKADVPVYTIRHYTKIGSRKPEKNQSNGYKMYPLSDAVKLRFILGAKNLGFTLAEISEILVEAQNARSPCPTVRDIIKLRIEENKRKIRELQNLQRKMEKAVGSWEQMRNQAPTGASVCHLIESVAESEKAA